MTKKIVETSVDNCPACGCDMDEYKDGNEHYKLCCNCEEKCDVDDE